MRVLVTGGAGFIGSHVVDLLVENRHEIFVIDNLLSGIVDNINKKAVFYCIDLGDYDKIREIFEKEKFDVVYHLAAQIDIRKSVEEPIKDAEINILNSLNLLELCVKFSVKKFIFSSSGGAVYGDNVEVPSVEGAREDPISPYGISKLSVEKYLNFYNKVYGLEFVSLRYSNVYGPRQNSKGEAGVIAIFFDRMLDNKKPIIFGGEQTRDFVYVGDVARANLIVLDYDKIGIFNVGTGVETDIIGLFYKMNKFFGNKFEPEFREKKKGEQLRSCLNCEKIFRELGWKAEVELEQGLEKTDEWFRKEANIFSI